MENFLDMLVDELAINVIKVVGAFVAAGAGYLFIKVQGKIEAFFKARLTNEQFNMLKTGADLIVKYLAQTDYLGLTNPEKKERAILWLKDYVAEKGLPFSDEDIDKAIEAAVLSMKQGWDLARG